MPLASIDFPHHWHFGLIRIYASTHLYAIFSSKQGPQGDTLFRHFLILILATLRQMVLLALWCVLFARVPWEAMQIRDRSAFLLYFPSLSVPCNHHAWGPGIRSILSAMTKAWPPKSGFSKWLQFLHAQCQSFIDQPRELSPSPNVQIPVSESWGCPTGFGPQGPTQIRRLLPCQLVPGWLQLSVMIRVPYWSPIPSANHPSFRRPWSGLWSGLLSALVW